MTLQAIKTYIEQHGFTAFINDTNEEPSVSFWIPCYIIDLDRYVEDLITVNTYKQARIELGY